MYNQYLKKIIISTNYMSSDRFKCWNKRSFALRFRLNFIVPLLAEHVVSLFVSVNQKIILISMYC